MKTILIIIKGICLYVVGFYILNLLFVIDISTDFNDMNAFICNAAWWLFINIKIIFEVTGLEDDK
jgi:hypothetical protein